MFTAARRARRQAASKNEDDDGTHEKSMQQLAFDLAESCKQGIQAVTQAAGRVRRDVSRTISLGLDDHPGRIPTLTPSAFGPALLASVSTSSSANDAVVTLPSKDRAKRPAKVVQDAAAAVLARSQGDAKTSSSSLGPTRPDSDDDADSERILISEIDVSGVKGRLKEVVLNALSMRPNFAYTTKEVQEDMERVFDSGYFVRCSPVAEDTRDGVRLTIQVEPNAELKGVVAEGASALPQAVVQEAFRGMRGRTLNFNALTDAVAKINKWYQDRGVVGQVIDVALGQDDVAHVRLSEARVSRIALRYIDPKTGEVREEGKTRPEVILRHLTIHPGQIYNQKQASSDMEAVYSLGLFEDVIVSPSPAEGSTLEAPKMDLTLSVKEKKKMGGLSAGGGIKNTDASGGGTDGSLPGFVGTVSYSQKNLFGLGQRLVASAEVGQSDSTFRVAHTDPWVRGDAQRTSRTVSAQNVKVSVAPIHGPAADDDDEAGGSGDNVSVSRMIGSVEYGRPLGRGFQGSLGLSWQRARCVDDHNRPVIHDTYSHSELMLNRGGKGYDTMALGNMRVAYNSPSGNTEMAASMDQAVPLQRDWLNFNRFSVRADKTVPVGPLRLFFSAKGGAILGDLPSYEAFPIGGTNSVRGYSEGGVGSGRNYGTGTAEIQFPFIAPLVGTVFADYGTDFGSGATVPGDPAGSRGKPGVGYGVGAGVRIDTPIGPLRLEYAMNDARKMRFHLGIGSHG